MGSGEVGCEVEGKVEVEDKVGGGVGVLVVAGGSGEEGDEVRPGDGGAPGLQSLRVSKRQ